MVVVYQVARASSILEDVTTNSFFLFFFLPAKASWPAGPGIQYRHTPLRRSLLDSYIGTVPWSIDDWYSTVPPRIRASPPAGIKVDNK